MEIHDKKIYYHGGSLKNPIFKCVCVCGGGGGGGHKKTKYGGGGGPPPSQKKYHSLTKYMSLHQKMCFRDNIVRITGLFLSGSQKHTKNILFCRHLFYLQSFLSQY